MNDIQVTARFAIHSGKIVEFKQLAEDCLTSVRDKDTGTLQYDWFFNADQSECVVRERYSSSEAVLEHMGNLGDLLGSLLAISDFTLEVYGDPSPELLEAGAALNPQVFSFFQGA